MIHPFLEIALTLAIPIAPAILARRTRWMLFLLLPALAVQVGVAFYRFHEARGILSALDTRVRIPLPASDGPHRVMISPLPGVESVHVSVVGKDGHPVQGDLGVARWSLPGFDAGLVTWFRGAEPGLKLPGDGTPLFELGRQPLKEPLTLNYVITPESKILLEGAQLHVRADWFSLKMLPPVAMFLRFLGICHVVGLALALTILLWPRRTPVPL